MYHSHLLINVGDHPDRPDWNIARRWLRNLYRVHQRLCMGFPSRVGATREERIAEYCAPYTASSLTDPRCLLDKPAATDVHYARSDEGGFLFRIDHPVDLRRGVRRPVILVQSASKPNWNYAFGLNEDDIGRPIGNASFLLAAPPRLRKISIEHDGKRLALACPSDPAQSRTINEGDRVSFRLRANPVRTIDGKRHRLWIPNRGSDAGSEVRQRIFTQAHLDWLQRKLGTAADSVEVPTLVSGWARAWRTRHEPQPSQRMQWWSVLFEGTFRVQDVTLLKVLLESGVGPGKAFGFGLLSIAPVR